jgi:hypothetical protein
LTQRGKPFGLPFCLLGAAFSVFCCWEAWQGNPYLILSLGSHTLAGWTSQDGRIDALAVTSLAAAA